MPMSRGDAGRKAVNGRMKKRITLTIEEDYILAAKEYAKKEGKSVSQLVEGYFDIMGKPRKPVRKEDLPPLTRSLTGILKDADIRDYRTEYRKHLEEKYR